MSGLDENLTKTFTAIQIVNLACAMTDQIPNYLSIVGLKCKGVSNFLAFFFICALATQLGFFEFIITLNLVLHALRNQKLQ